jgi:hypothetical protein
MMPTTLEGKQAVRPKSLGNNNARKHGGYSQKMSWQDQARYQAFVNIRERCRHRGYGTDLEMSDMPVIPHKCPVLGIVLKPGTLKGKDASPSIDKFNPNLPYLKKYKENLVFISHRANRIKADANAEELRRVLEYMLGGISIARCEFPLMDLNPEIGNKAEGLMTHRERLNEETAQAEAIVRSVGNNNLQRAAEMTAPSVLNYLQIH